VLAYHGGRQVLPLDQAVEIALRLHRQRGGGDLDALPAGELGERPPAAADFQHMIAGFEPERVGGDLHLAGHRVFQRLVVVGEDALGVAAVPVVQEGQEELGVLVVVVRDGAPVVLRTPAQQRRSEPGDPGDRVDVAEEPAHLERHGQVAVDVQPALQVGHRHAELIQAGQRPGAPTIPDGDGELGRAGAEGVRGGAGRGRHGERDRRTCGEEVTVPALQRRDHLLGGHALNVAARTPPRAVSGRGAPDVDSVYRADAPRSPRGRPPRALPVAPISVADRGTMWKPGCGAGSGWAPVRGLLCGL
jgi:hypothetical protein